jgi:hypothetical protein
MNTEQKQISTDLIKAHWQTLQSLCERSSSIRWKIRGGGAVVWWATLSFAVSNNKFVVLWSLYCLILVIFIYEYGLSIKEHQILKQNKKVEKLLSALVAGDFDAILDHGAKISTLLPKAAPNDYFRMFKLSKILFWGPYLAVLLSTIAIHYSVSAFEVSSKAEEAQMKRCVVNVDRSVHNNAVCTEESQHGQLKNTVNAQPKKPAISP